MKRSLADLIPNHPARCKGVRSSRWTGHHDQCRLCWLGTYDPRYQALWGITRKAPGRVPARLTSITDLPPEERWPCLHRGTDKINVQGCGTCQGISALYPCQQPLSGVTRCFVAGTPSQENTVRTSGNRVCRECGWREPEPDLEYPVPRLRSWLETDPASLPAGWPRLRAARIVMLDMLRDFLGEEHPLPRPAPSGRGIVTVAGGPLYFPLAFSMIHCLRELGCRLPIQIWHLGEAEVDSTIRALCDHIGVTLVDSLSLPEKTRISGGWETKAFAIKHCPFQEVLFLDADCYPVRNPEFLFEDAGYLRHGAMFWADIPHRADFKQVTPAVWSAVGLRPRHEPDFESGQMLIDKVRCWKELLTAQWFNTYSDYWYDLIYGDKDTFHLAWRSNGSDYALAPPPSWNAPFIEQPGPDGELLFQHACQGKRSVLSGDCRDSFRMKAAIDASQRKLRELVRVLTKVSGDVTILTSTENPPCERKSRRFCKTCDPPPIGNQSTTSPPSGEKSSDAKPVCPTVNTSSICSC